MLIEDHRNKAARFDAAAAELSDAGRGILGTWALLHAMTHRLNAALHEVGVTAERDECPTNAMGSYVSRTGSPLSIEPSAASVGDLIHSDMPRVNYPSDAAWERAEAALARLERLAATCMRGPHRDGVWRLAEARAAAEEFQNLLGRALARTRSATSGPAAPAAESQ